MIIGIGAEQNIDKIADAAKSIEDVKLIVYTHENWTSSSTLLPKNLKVHVSDTPELDLITALHNDNIDAGVRGTLPANKVMKCIKSVFSVDKLRRIAVLEINDGKYKGRKFILAPVGVDEGWSVQEKLDLIADCKNQAKISGIDTKVAVLSGGRAGDIGRHIIVDRTIHDAEEIAKITGADNGEILIEDAIRDHGIVIAPDGISGNLIFRTLCLLGNGIGHGAPVTNIDKIFIDTSRANSEYVDALRLAEFQVNFKTANM